MTNPEIERFSGAGHHMQRYLRDIGAGELWYLTTAKGVSRETVAKIQKRIHRLQLDRDFYAYSAWIFETKPKLHAHFLFVGDRAVIEGLKRSYGTTIFIGSRSHPDKPVYDLPRLVKGYHAKERTPQAGWGRNYGRRIKDSHRLEGGGDRVRLSHQLERDGIQAGLVVDRPHKNAKRKDDRKPSRLKNTGPYARAPRLSGQIQLDIPELSKPVARLRAFGGGKVPKAVASEIEHLRRQLGLSQRQLAVLVGRSQGQLANALRGHDPISAPVVNRLRDVLLTVDRSEAATGKPRHLLTGLL